jgi:hypothetical protein
VRLRSVVAQVRPTVGRLGLAVRSESLASEAVHLAHSLAPLVEERPVVPAPRVSVVRPEV